MAWRACKGAGGDVHAWWCLIYSFCSCLLLLLVLSVARKLYEIGIILFTGACDLRRTTTRAFGPFGKILRKFHGRQPLAALGDCDFLWMERALDQFYGLWIYDQNYYARLLCGVLLAVYDVISSIMVDHEI